MVWGNKVSTDVCALQNNLLENMDELTIAAQDILNVYVGITASYKLRDCFP
jgi:hypothetical protein